MPLNLAQTAISVLRLGENALTAIYSGITRVYPNEVTVSIDGANASTQSGTPGQSMNNLIYTVNPSSGSTSGWTAAQISAATLTGLPAGFTATFSSSGGLGSQVGTWSINTTDGLLPAVDTTILVSSLTSTIAQTTYGTLNISISGSDVIATTVSRVGFVGTNTSVTAVGTYITDVGYLIGNVSGMSGSYSSGQNYTSFVAGGVNSYRITATFYYTINSGTTNASATTSGYGTGIFTARQPSYLISGPPWNTNPTPNIQCFLNNYYGSTGPVIDNRVRTWSYTDFTGGTVPSPYNFEQNYNLQTSSNPRFYQLYPGSGSGSYTINTQTNFGIAGSVWAADSTSRNLSPIVSVSWNWT